MSTVNLTQTLTDTINNLADSPVILGAELLPPLADNLNNWADLVEMSLDLPVTLSDNLNNWSDVVAITIVGDLQFTLADAINNWSDFFTLLSDGQVILADSINNLADSPVALADGLLPLSDDLNQWTDSASVLGDELVTLADNLNNWLESIRSFLGPGIDFDACSVSGDQFGTSYSWLHTCSGNNRILFVTIDINNVGLGTGSVTYGGVPLTLIRRDVQIPYHTELWYLKSPPAGTALVAVTLTGFTAEIDSVAAANSFTGVDQTAPIEADAGASGFSTDASVGVVTLTAGAWVIDTLATTETTSPIGGGVDHCSQSGTVGFGGVSTFGPKTPPGLVTMAWATFTLQENWVISAAAFKPFSGLFAAGDSNIVVGKPSRVQAGSLTIVGSD